MHVVQAGLAFRMRAPISELPARLSPLVGMPLTELPAAGAPGGFDTRREGDLMVQRFGDVWFICNAPLALQLLKQSKVGETHRLLGAPERLFAYCHDDDRASYGYAVYEHGVHRRTRRQWHSVRGNVPRLVERGAPMAFEQRWLASPHYFEAGPGGHGQGAKMHYRGAREVLVPERRLTGRMLRDGLESNFQVCPWTTLMTPTYRFLRGTAPEGDAQGADTASPSSLAPATEAAADAASTGADRRWWKLF